MKAEQIVKDAQFARENEIADALIVLTEHIFHKTPDALGFGFLGGRFGYGGEWSSPVFEMHPDGDYDCDCGQEAAQVAAWPKEPKKGASRGQYRQACDDVERRFPCLPTCITVRPHFKHHASGLAVRWYKYIGRSMEIVDPGVDMAAILAECIADVAAPPFTPWKPKVLTDAEMDATLDRWEKEFKEMEAAGAVQFFEIGGDGDDDNTPF